jgi:membrane associated rhomboid family serine protease
MAWSDRRYDDDGQESRLHRPGAIFVLLGALLVAHVVKVLFVGLQIVDPRWASQWLGVQPGDLLRGFVWQPLTYQFVHGHFGHLFWNGFTLFIVGRILEPMIGGKKVVWVCLGGGAAAALGVFMPGAGFMPTVGISGGIAALWVLAWVIAPNVELNLIFFTVRLKYVAGFFLLANLLRAFGDGNQAMFNPSGVAYSVHLMGMLAGFVYAHVWPRYLEPWFRATRARQERRREVERIERELSSERELDRILDKINREGMPSLTEDERRFLKKTASKYQGTRR